MNLMNKLFRANSKMLTQCMALILCMLSLSSHAGDSISTRKTVYVFDLRKEIGPATWRTTMQSIDRAVEMKA